MQSLHRFLVDYDIAMLRAVAQSRGAALDTNRQTEAADQLAATLLDPLSVRTALARLSPGAEEALAALLAAGGWMRAPQFARRFGQVRPFGPGRLAREAPWLDPANPAEELLYAGLVFRAFLQDDAGPGEFILIPEDLRPLLPQPQNEPPVSIVAAVPEPPAPGAGAAAGGHAPALVGDLFTYLVYLQNHDVRPYADGRLSRGDLDDLRGRLAGAPTSTGERRLAFVRHLAERLGFVTRQGDYLRLEAAAVKGWLTAPAAHQVAMLQATWRDDPTWNDLCHVPSLVCDADTGWQNDPVATRRALLALLARCPPDGVWSLDAFVAAAKDHHPDFQRPDGDYDSWYIRDAGSGEYLSGFASWDRVEGALIADLLGGPLDWLGVVDTIPGDGGPVCRLTEAGARFAGLRDGEVETPPPPPITVHADFRVEIPLPASLYTRFQLERFAELESAEPLCYRLTVDSLGRALARDIEAQQVVAFLGQASGGQVPASVARQLLLWARRFGQVHLEEGALLTVKSEQALKELSALPETRALLGRILSPTSALVSRKDLPRLREALHKLGYLIPGLPGGHG